jgi:prepilin-type N-terminal cleavage/methylation domain-containing protein
MMGLNTRSRLSRGFTLIEILIVVVILGILAALTVPHFGQAAEEASETAAHSQLNVLRGQVTLYWAKYGSTTSMGVTVGEVVQTLTDEGMLSSSLNDEDALSAGFQVSGGYTLTWDPSTGALEALAPDGSSSGW